MPTRHAVELRDIHPDNLKKIILSTYERQAESFEILLGMPGVGPKTIRALTLIAELVYDRLPAAATRRSLAMPTEEKTASRIRLIGKRTTAT